MNGNQAYILSKKYTDKTVAIEGVGFKQYGVLPASDKTGAIVQYVGETNGDLTNGFIYRYDGTKWVNIPVQSSSGGAGSPDGLAYISVAKKGYVTTVTAEDSRGTTVTYITDGKDGVDGMDGLTPTVMIGQNGNWIINSIDTGVKAQGAKGEKGDGFSIDEKYDTTEDMIADTDNVEDSKMVVVLEDKQLYLRVDGYTDGNYNGWMEIGGLGDLTVIKGDKGDKGEDGANGLSPTIDPTTKHWMIGTYDTGIIAEGKNGTNGRDGVNGADGITPSIHPTTKHWMIGINDTGILAEGFVPTIGINASGNWVINNVDSGRSAYPIINGNKHWVVDGIDTGIVAEAQDGDKGDTGNDGFSPIITQERDDNKVTLTINQKTGTETVEIFDGLNSYNDLELRGRIQDLEDDVEILNGDSSIEGSVDYKIVDAFSKFTSIKFERVNSLPQTGENGVFYLIPSNKTAANNIYDEYIYYGGNWEFLGTTEVDLSSYAKKSEIPTKVSDLTNDTGFITANDLPGKATANDLGLVRVDNNTIVVDSNGIISGTQRIGISNTAGNILTSKNDGYYVPPTDLSDYAQKSTVPNKTSQLTNDSGYITQNDVPTKLSQLTNDLVATTKKLGTVMPDGDTVTIDGNGTITAKIGENSLSRQEGNQIELLDDGIYIGALNEEAIYNTIDAVDLASPILTEYTEEELYQLAWEDITVEEKEEYTEEELDSMLDEIDLSGVIGDGGDENVIESISVNGVDIVPDANKNVALTIITNAVNDLVNYYKKTETYSKGEINDLISTIQVGGFEIVNELPTENIDLKTIYLVPKTGSANDVHNEYVYINNNWELIGSTSIDLSNYVTTTILNTTLEDYISTTDLTTLLNTKEDKSVSLTQAQYNALTETQKTNGTTYYITDAVSVNSMNAVCGFTPIGTVISVMGNSAPANYLTCNGQVVNIADYPELANYFEEQFGSKNNFGGDGTTTFAVPDLRGEFLRGSGTNSHTNQGNGANVGEHQDGTEMPSFAAWGSPYKDIEVSTGKVSKKDSEISTGTQQYLNNTYENTNPSYGLFTSRPTNTSVLYCIATKNIYVDARYDYSLDEKVVGTWIDGKPIYQKSFETANNLTGNNIIVNSDLSSLSIDNIVDVEAFKVRASDHFIHQVPNNYISENGTAVLPSFSIIANRSFINVRQNNDYRNEAGKFYVTIKYTKTTDTATVSV